MVESEFSLVRFSGDEERAGKVYAGMIALSPEHMNVSELLILPVDQASTQMVYRRDD